MWKLASSLRLFVFDISYLKSFSLCSVLYFFGFFFLLLSGSFLSVLCYELYVFFLFCKIFVISFSFVIRLLDALRRF